MTRCHLRSFSSANSATMSGDKSLSSLRDNSRSILKRPRLVNRSKRDVYVDFRGWYVSETYLFIYLLNAE